MADPSDLFQEFHPFPFFSSDPGSDSDSESESESDNTLTLDLFCRRRHPSPSSAPSTMEPPGFLGLTLGLGFPNHEDDISDHRDQALGHTLALRFPDQQDDVSDMRDHELGYDWPDDEFFIGWRPPGSSACLINEDGLRILGFESDDDEERIVAISEAESGLPLCWDCLRLDDGEVADDIEWEEIDSHAEERDTITPMYDDKNEGENAATINEEESSNDINWDLLLRGEETMASNWEVLLTMHRFGSPSAGSHVVEDLDYVDDFFVYTSEYDEVLFDQFQEHERSIKGSLPAARSVVEGLQTVVLRKEDVGESSVCCAVCKDDIAFEEKAKKLPCCHYYHKECILPWLRMRNTCPLCRYELPTDDAEYESWKVGRAGNNGG